MCLSLNPHDRGGGGLPPWQVTKLSPESLSSLSEVTLLVSGIAIGSSQAAASEPVHSPLPLCREGGIPGRSGGLLNEFSIQWGREGKISKAPLWFVENIPLSWFRLPQRQTLRQGCKCRHFPWEGRQGTAKRGPSDTGRGRQLTKRVQAPATSMDNWSGMPWRCAESQGGPALTVLYLRGKGAGMFIPHYLQPLVRAAPRGRKLLTRPATRRRPPALPDG